MPGEYLTPYTSYGECQVSTHPATLQAQDGTRTGGLIRDWGMIMTADGDSVCWDNVNMGGNTQASLLYSCGETDNDSVDIVFQSTTIGNIVLPYCVDVEAWDGNCGTESDTFAAQSGTGTLCLVGVGAGWIAAINQLDVQ